MLENLSYKKYGKIKYNKLFETMYLSYNSSCILALTTPKLEVEKYASKYMPIICVQSQTVW